MMTLTSSKTRSKFFGSYKKNIFTFQKEVVSRSHSSTLVYNYVQVKGTIVTLAKSVKLHHWLVKLVNSLGRFSTKF